MPSKCNQLPTAPPPSPEHDGLFVALARAISEGILLIENERVIYATPNSAQRLGYTVHALHGQALSTLLAESDYPLLQRQLREPPENTCRPVLRRFRHNDGSCFYMGISLTELSQQGHVYKLLVLHPSNDEDCMRNTLTESNRQLQAITRKLLSLQEDERRAISRDLHDDIGQSITAIKLSAHAALDEQPSDACRDDLQEIINLSNSTLSRLRDLSTLLRPPQLDALGLEAALRAQASMLFRSATARLQLEIQPLSKRPCNEVEQACFRIAQESLTNTLRHACAGEVTLILRHENPQQLYLEVSDDGNGFELTSATGLGHIVMRERAQSAGGSLSIDSAPGAGTRVMLHLPYQISDSSCSSANEC
jgi:PAS domain S-box-containing protein